MRTTSNIETLMVPLENTIRSILLPALLNGYRCNDMERNLFSLPAKFGGLVIFKPQERCSVEYASRRFLRSCSHYGFCSEVGQISLDADFL